MYRVWKKIETAYGESVELVWTGSSLSELLTKYPPPPTNVPLALDPLVSFRCETDGSEISHWWEISTNGENWTPIRDPRYMRIIL